jgi:hypothetical protein
VKYANLESNFKDEDPYSGSSLVDSEKILWSLSTGRCISQMNEVIRAGKRGSDDPQFETRDLYKKETNQTLNFRCFPMSCRH